MFDINCDEHIEKVHLEDLMKYLGENLSEYKHIHNISDNQEKSQHFIHFNDFITHVLQKNLEKKSTIRSEALK
jgi:Ca2+-binding EF-hand superfamily protein